MTDQVREHYFLAIRVGLLMTLEVYIVLSQYAVIGASAEMLLLLALEIGALAGKELAVKRWRFVFLILAVVFFAILMTQISTVFLLIGVYFCYEILSFRKMEFLWYVFPLGMACYPSGIDIYIQIILTMLIAIIYIQHDFIVASYRKQTKEDTIQEQTLKRNMYERENEMQEEIKKGLLLAQNQNLEERAQLSQTLHDKLGHNINGSVYQLEAIKVLMEKDPEKSQKMIQAVIDQLRTGMDEIRAILRKERPKKYKLALMQLEKLCAECRQKGVDTELFTEGDMTCIPEKYLEIILDNAYEAVSNSMKYAKCTKIIIKIHVMNQLVRCSIVDNGIGCETIEDGMGISGIRKRIREINGLLDFKTDDGFAIYMLLPLTQNTD